MLYDDDVDDDHVGFYDVDADDDDDGDDGDDDVDDTDDVDADGDEARCKNDYWRTNNAA